MLYLNKSRISIVLITILMGFSIACSRPPNDEAIANDIQKKASADPETSAVVVTARDGKVSLSGKVKTPEAQKKLEQIAHDEPGATSVDDQTTVGPETAASEAMAAPVQQEAPPPAAPPKPKAIVIPAGTALTVRLGQALGSKTSQTGQTFLATLAQPVSVGGRAALPAGATVNGTVVTAKAKGKIKGEGQLDLTLNGISSGGHTYQIQTALLSSTEKGKGKRTAVATGGGAAGGALIGGIAGGGKGAGIGALVGAGAGLVGGALTGNKQIELPAESALSFTLAQPLTLSARSD